MRSKTRQQIRNEDKYSKYMTYKELRYYIDNNYLQKKIMIDMVKDLQIIVFVKKR